MLRHCEKAAVGAVEGVTAVTMTIAPIEQPAVLPQLLLTTQTTLVMGTTHHAISLACLTLLSEDLRMAKILAEARILDTQCTGNDFKYEALWLHTTSPRKTLLEMLPCMRLTTMRTQFVPARIVNCLNFLVNIAMSLLFPPQITNQNLMSQLLSAPRFTPDSGNSVVLVADHVLWFGDELHCLIINPHQIRSNGYGSVMTRGTHIGPLGLTSNESIFVPLTVSGSNLFFETRDPTLREMENLPIIKIDHFFNLESCRPNAWSAVKSNECC